MGDNETLNQCTNTKKEKHFYFIFPGGQKNFGGKFETLWELWFPLSYSCQPWLCTEKSNGAVFYAIGLQRKDFLKAHNLTGENKCPRSFHSEKYIFD